MPYKFQLKPNAKPTRHAPRKVPIHLQDAFPTRKSGIWNNFGILEETKDVTEWGEQLCDCGEEDPNQLQQQSRTLQGQETKDLPRS